MVQVRRFNGSEVDLAEYARVPMAFEVCSRLCLLALRFGELFPLPITPYVKDYDQLGDGGPEGWPERFDLSRWQFWIAYEGTRPVGAATVAFGSPRIDLLDGRTDLAVLWDIRVGPSYARQGIGRAVLREAETWAQSVGCVEMKIETQDVNEPACRFYQAAGYRLAEVVVGEYEGLNDSCLFWRKALSSS